MLDDAGNIITTRKVTMLDDAGNIITTRKVRNNAG